MTKREIKFKAIVKNSDLGIEGLQIKKITTNNREFYVTGDKTDEDLGQLLYEIVDKEEAHPYQQIFLAINSQIVFPYKLSKEIGHIIDQNHVDNNNKHVRDALVEIYEKGFKVYEFSITEEDISAPPVTPETIKIKISSADFPKLPKSIKKITIDGVENWIAKDGTNKKDVGTAAYIFLGFYSVDNAIVGIINKKFPKLQVTEKQLHEKIEKKYFSEGKESLQDVTTYGQIQLLEKIWNEGIELEFEVEEEEVFPAL